MSYLTVLLTSTFEKETFSSGNAMLDNYLHKQARQDTKRNLSACFVLSDNGVRIKGYYTLSSSPIPQNDLPDHIARKLPPSYQQLPVTLLGRLAVDNTFKGQGTGRTLLIDALKRCYDVSEASIASMAVIVDPIDTPAANFYLKYGFIPLLGSGRMFLPMKTVGQLFASAE